MPDELPSPMGRNFIDMVQKSLFAVYILLYPPKTFFQHHEFSRICKPYDIYISLSLYRCLYLHIYILIFYIFFVWECLEWIMCEVIWHRRCSPLYLTTHCTHFLSYGHPPMDLIWGQSDISITCLSNCSFYKVFHSDHTAQCGKFKFIDLI